MEEEEEYVLYEEGDLIDLCSPRSDPGIQEDEEEKGPETEAIEV